MGDDERRAMLAQHRSHRLIEAGPIPKFQRETSSARARRVPQEFIDCFKIFFGGAKVRRKLQEDGSEFLLQNKHAF